ncbi:rhodanese-like domain-containing protein [Pelagibaculum spongiae]|uniref:Rhodanese-like domain-containing protein n=1 Tax=Pelagibaculum spongiae TaxID=2080658 RepID=A0A2V1GRW1_9GAMM|nr:rhodanese-like domain-containing protein [Pelagibaculum spongiae]PVZ68129.1 rhodanese-like domain-containing protein [Pelagibaculum spongiae]
MDLDLNQIIEFASSNALMVTAWVTLGILLIGTYAMGALNGVKRVDVHQLVSLVNSEDAQVIDIREAAEFKKGSIVGSKNQPRSQLTKDMTLLNQYKGKSLVLVCDLGQHASSIGGKLKKAGFEDLHILKGGINAWQQAKLPLKRSK